MTISKFHMVVGVLQKANHAIEKAVPHFKERSIFAEPPALAGVLLGDFHLRLLLQMEERNPLVSFTIQVNSTRIDGFFGGRPIFLWAGAGTGFEDTVYTKDLLSKPAETRVATNLNQWYATIEEICRFAAGNTKIPVARLVSTEKTSNSTLRRSETLPAMQMLLTKVA